MSKKHFIELANAIREHNRVSGPGTTTPFNMEHIEALADFCRSQNPRFMRGRWIAYINGECGSSGGAIKKAQLQPA